MHHMTVGNYTINFNGDFSGDVIFVSPDGVSHAIPFAHCESVVAEKVPRARISALFPLP